MTRVLLVDDQEIIRVGLRAILGSQKGMKVVADVADGFAALDVLANVDVDVVLMDIRMPGIDGVETVRRIRADASIQAVGIVMLTTFDHDDNVFAALRAGANGFLSKGAGPSELSAAITDVVQGGGALSATASASLIKHIAAGHVATRDGALAERFATLTARELDMVVAATAGLDNAQIAADAYLSPHTVKTHINRAMTKVGARDRAQLVVLAYRAGISQ